MNVLVTGATGFAGGALAMALVDEGHHVRALVRDPSRAGALADKGVELIRGDICNRQDVQKAVDGCKKVFHLAALYRDASVVKQAYWDVHVGGTENILGACAQAGVERLIHCSTMGVHGHVHAVPGDENSPFNPGDEYQRTKLTAEERVWDFGKKQGLKFTVVRPAGIYGPGDMRFLKLFKGIGGGYFVMLGNGKTTYHFVYIDDLVRGFLLASRLDSALNEAFIIGGAGYVTLNELTETIAAILGAPNPRWRLPVWPAYAAGALCEAVCVPLKINPPLYRRRVDFFTHSRGFRIDKARKLLGYEPQVSLRDGLSRTALWYSAKGLLPAKGIAVAGELMQKQVAP